MSYTLEQYKSHKGDLTIALEWTSKEDRENYLIDWHLAYGFGAGCELLMVDLDTNILIK